MCGVVVLHPKDVLRDGYNRMPLISPSPSTNQTYKSRISNPNSGSNRRKRSPKKKTNDLTKLAPKRSNFDHSFNVSQKKFNDVCKSPLKSYDFDLNSSKKKINGLSKSPPKNSNFAHNFKVSQRKINDFDQKVNSGSGLPRVLAKGGANFSNGKISSGNKLVMENVKILKRGEVLTSDDDTKKEEVLSDKENMMVNLENNAVSNTEKKVLFDEENKNGKVVNIEKNGDEKTEKKMLFAKENKYEKVVNVEKNGNEKTKKKMFAKENKYEKVVNIEKNGDEKTKKKMVLFDRDNKNKKKVLEKNEDLKPNVDLDSVELLMRLSPEPEMVPKHIQLADFYASAAFVASPDPSSLPFPPFLKKGVAEIELTPEIGYSNDDDNGSSHLRRLLKLGF